MKSAFLSLTALSVQTLCNFQEGSRINDATNVLLIEGPILYVICKHE